MRFLNFFAATSFLIVKVFADYSPYLNFNEDVKEWTEELTGEYSAFHLKNKLDVIVHVHDDNKLPKLSVSLTVGVGSSNVSKNEPQLEQNIPGLAHLVEHCMFYASSEYPNPYESRIFFNSRFLHASGETSNYDTTYVLSVGDQGRILESLDRFAHLFISPIFTPEVVKAQILTINNEWIDGVNNIGKIWHRLPQLLMSKDQPSELFGTGNRESLINATAEQVELFWKTHYTAENMKLAISVHKSCKETVEELIIKNFSRINTSLVNNEPTQIEPAADFWSPAHKDQYLKVYTRNARHNHLHLYWHIHCDAAGLCDDSVKMTINSIRFCAENCLGFRKVNTHLYRYSYNEFVIRLSLRLRDKELPYVKSLKDKVINSIVSCPAINKFSRDYPTIKVPDELAKSLSKAMMESKNLTEAPIRAHLPLICSNEADQLRKTHLNMISGQTTRMIVSYKSSKLKGVKKQENIQFDPYFFIYYQFADFGNDDSSTEIPKSKESMNTPYSITLRIDHPPASSYPYQFLRRVFVEILLIELNRKKVYCESAFDHTFFEIKVYFEDENSWEPVMRELVQSFSSLKLSSNEVFEKAKNRSLLEMKAKSSTVDFRLGSIAAEYAKIFTATEPLSQSSLLVSDPYPKNVTFEEVANVGHIIQKIGTLKVSSDSDFDFEIDAFDIIDKVSEMWTNGITHSDYTSTYIQPGKDETFIYVPPNIPTPNSGLMILFILGEHFSAHSQPLTVVLERLLFQHLRTEMNLVYSFDVGVIAKKYIYIMVSSPETPETLLDAIESVMKKIPDYIRGMGERKNKEMVIDTAQKYIIENRAGRLIIQFWGKDKRAERNEYLARMSLTSSPPTKMILSIKDYPRTGKVPEDLLVGESSIVEDQLRDPNSHL